jgi:hypothetical protein
MKTYTYNQAPAGDLGPDFDPMWNAVPLGKMK